MRVKRRQRLILVLMLVVGVGAAIGLTLNALNRNINLFFSPTQVQAGEVPPDSLFRIGGMVVANSVQRSESDLSVTFELTDTAESVAVAYTGILPDLFREGQGIVALGRMQDDVFVAREVLAKHDENYMPPEVDAAIKAAHANRGDGEQGASYQ